MFALLDDLMTAPWVWHNMHHPAHAPWLDREGTWYHSLFYTQRWMNDAGLKEEHRVGYDMYLVYIGCDPVPVFHSDVKRRADQIREQPSGIPGVLAKRMKKPLDPLIVDFPPAPARPPRPTPTSSDEFVLTDGVMSSFEHIDGLSVWNDPDHRLNQP